MGSRLDHGTPHGETLPGFFSFMIFHDSRTTAAHPQPTDQLTTDSTIPAAVRHQVTMIPMAGPMQVVGPPTPEMQEKLRKIRFCVIGTFIGAMGRFCTGDTPVNDLLCAIVGIFLLNDDPNVAPCYACLASSPLGQCSMGGHGLSCAMTYAFLAGFNAIFLLFKLFSDGPFVFVSFGSQVCSLDLLE